MEPPLPPSEFSNATAIYNYLFPEEKQKTSSDYRLVLRTDTDSGKRVIHCIEKGKVGLWEGFLAKFFKCGDASLQNVLDFAIKEKIINAEKGDKQIGESLYTRIYISEAKKNLIKPAALKTMIAFTTFASDDASPEIKFNTEKELLDFIRYNENVSPEDALKLFEKADKEKIFNLAIESKNEEIITFLHKNKIHDANGDPILWRLVQQAILTKKQCAMICKLLRDEALTLQDKIKIFEEAFKHEHMDLLDSILNTPALVGHLIPYLNIRDPQGNTVLLG